MPRADASRRRCAIYTRKSSEEGLEQEAVGWSRPTAAQSSSPPSWGVPTVKPSGFGVRPLAGSFLTRRWRKQDSNPRSHYVLTRD
jgi:hypothetical protein